MDAPDLALEVTDGPRAIHRIIGGRAEAGPGAIAITSPQRQPLHFSQLLSLVEATVEDFNAWGLGRNDRVALVLPNGPEAATAFLAASCAATAAPLNPAYRENEFDFYLSDLQAQALLIPRDFASPARTVAARRGIAIVDLIASETVSGQFRLARPTHPGRPARSGFAGPDDVALMLHTSGTTSRPKLVPLTHANLCASARNIRETLCLTPEDRCLNVMPLFHIHGLIGALLSSLSAGASVVCAPGFVATDFFAWISALRPTWYTAVPTIHQALLARAGSHREIIRQSSLRFIRSSSAPLPPAVMRDLEAAFNTPVIESYGMTEASHQMSSNPLPPGERKAGSVGRAAGPQVAIMDGHGDLLSPNARGEVVIRGPNVTRGYESNPDANAAAFNSGWFRTGDEGYLDADGYLFLTGRLKELINRGGEKIAPREVDEVLQGHPDVAQAVAFAIPDSRLGEEVGAVVVLRTGADLTEPQLRKHAAAHLADFKVPRRIVIVDEIPKGPTGKLQRIGLAERLGISLESVPLETPAAPRNEIEQALLELWTRTLSIPQAGIHDHFLSLGGDSILAARLINAVRQTFGVDLPLIEVFEESSTIASMAVRLEVSERAFE